MTDPGWEERLADGLADLPDTGWVIELHRGVRCGGPAVSADAPGTAHDSGARNERPQPAEPDRTRSAEQAPNQQQTEAGPPVRAEPGRRTEPAHPGDAARSEHADHDRQRDNRQQQVPDRRESATATATWPPPQADIDRARALYRDDFGRPGTGDNGHGGRDRGDNVVGGKPAKSPGDTSDLPPAGQDLLEPEGKDEPRLEKLGNKLFREFGDVDDAVKEQTQTVQDLMVRSPPAGHAEVQVPFRAAVRPGNPRSIPALMLVPSLRCPWLWASSGSSSAAGSTIKQKT